MRYLRHDKCPDSTRTLMQRHLQCSGKMRNNGEACSLRAARNRSVREARTRVISFSSRCSRGKFMYPGMRPRAVKCNFANPNSAPESQIRGLMYRKYQTNELSRRFKRVVTVVACWSARPRTLAPVSRRDL